MNWNLKYRGKLSSCRLTMTALKWRCQKTSTVLIFVSVASTLRWWSSYCNTCNRWKLSVDNKWFSDSCLSIFYCICHWHEVFSTQASGYSSHHILVSCWSRCIRSDDTGLNLPVHPRAWGIATRSTLQTRLCGEPVPRSGEWGFRCNLISLQPEVRYGLRRADMHCLGFPPPPKKTCALICS